MEIVEAHIQLSKQHTAPYAILPGDPARVDRIGSYLTDVEELAYNREIKSIRGYYQGIPILVVSTGMGGVSTGIVVEELHHIGVTHMIRVGSAGGMQPQIAIGDLILVNGAVRDDGVSHAYVRGTYPAIPNTEVLINLITMAQQLELNYHVGLARSHESFYTDDEESINKYWSNKGILAADMETAALFTIGALRGIKTASILNVVVQSDSDTGQGIQEYVNGEEQALQGECNEILLALETIVHTANNVNEK